MADIRTYEERIKSYLEMLKNENGNQKCAILQKKIQRDRISIELKRLNS